MSGVEQLGLLSSVKRRIVWDAARAGIWMQWLHWDSMGVNQRARPLTLESLYERQAPNAFANDPLAHRAGLSPPGLEPDLDVEFVRRLRQAVILEPDFGYAIVPPGRLLPETLPHSHVARMPNQMNVFCGVPSRRKYNSSLANGKFIRYEPQLVSLRHPFETNFYHFHADVMSRLHLFDQVGIDPAIPLVIGARLARQPFFHELVARGALARRKWLVQEENVYLQTDDLVFGQTRHYVPGHIEHLLSLMEVPIGDASQSRRVFLTRDKKFGRYIVNMTEIQPILDEFGFEVVDTGGWSLEDQIKLFQQIGYLIGLHGAGLTNIVYRHGAPLRLLEIFGPNRAPVMYYGLTKEFGFQYDYIIGGNASSRSYQAPFYLSPGLLREKLVSTLHIAEAYPRDHK